MKRRDFLSGVAGLGVSGLGAGALFSGFSSRVDGFAPPTTTGPNTIIDVHCHLSPPTWISELKRMNNLTGQVRDWTPARSIEDMDQAGVATAITSMTTPVTIGMEGDLAKRIAREGNDYAAKLVSDYKGRFGMFTNLLMPDVDATLKEIEYGLDTLKADGVAMMTNFGDIWLGDAKFAPVFEELNRRKAVIYTHPTGPNCCRNLIKGVPDTAIEYGTDTSRVIAQMIFSGASQKYPDIKVIFSHAGGTMPFLMERFKFLAKTQYSKQLPKGFEPEAAKFYYDIAQAFSSAGMSALKNAVPVSQIVFGTDYPFRTSADHVKGLKDCGIFTPKEVHAIQHENPLRILPRFKS